VYTYDAYLEDIRALLSAERIQAPILLGHSMGGMLLVKYTSIWPQEVGALVVCDAMPVYSLEAANRLQQTGQRQGREYATLEEYITHYRIRPDGLRASPEVHRHIARHAACQRPNGRWAHKIDRRVYAQRQAIDTWPYWHRITCPVLVLRAEYSPRLTPAILQQMKAACPHVEVATVADAGHHLVLDQPEQTVALVLEFLRRHRLLDDKPSSQLPSSIPG
jgi:non-heme chloroperoxidase